MICAHGCFHFTLPSIFLYYCRHGESEYNEVGRIGGNSSLSPHGWQYASALAEFVSTNVIAIAIFRLTVFNNDLMTVSLKITKDPASGEDVPARLWTSTMRRTMETASLITSPVLTVRCINYYFYYLFVVLQVSSMRRDPTDPLNIIQWHQMRPRAWCNLDELYAGIAVLCWILFGAECLPHRFL